MRHSPSGRQLFAELIRQPQEHIDLIQASLAVASEDRDDVNVDRSLRILAHIVERSNAAISPGLSTTDRARELVTYLHDIEGFTGERDNYDDPANSYLHLVLYRRIGLPITLSLILLHVGQQLGLPVAPSALPGHFMVRCASDDGAIFLDLLTGACFLAFNAVRFCNHSLATTCPNQSAFCRQRVIRCWRVCYGTSSAPISKPRNTDWRLRRPNVSCLSTLVLPRMYAIVACCDHGLAISTRGYGTWNSMHHLEPMAKDLSTVKKYAQTLGDTLGRRN